MRVVGRRVTVLSGLIKYMHKHRKLRHPESNKPFYIILSPSNVQIYSGIINLHNMQLQPTKLRINSRKLYQQPQNTCRALENDVMPVFGVIPGMRNEWVRTHPSYMTAVWEPWGTLKLSACKSSVAYQPFVVFRCANYLWIFHAKTSCIIYIQDLRGQGTSTINDVFVSVRGCEHYSLRIIIINGDFSSGLSTFCPSTGEC